MYKITIEKWRPATLNELLAKHPIVRYRQKKKDMVMIATHCMINKIPKAEGKRRVSMYVVLSGRQQQADPDSYLKTVHDALVMYGALVDDSAQYLEIGGVTYDRALNPSFSIILEDI